MFSLIEQFPLNPVLITDDLSTLKPVNQDQCLKVSSTNINVYGTTASNPTESSYACYYDATRQAYLGDLYSVNWMEDSDVEDINSETLFQQFGLVKATEQT